MSADALPSTALLDTLLFDWLKTGGEDERATLHAILDTAHRLAAEHFLPHYRQGDIDEPRLEADGVHVLPAIGEALARYAELGLFGASFAEDQGGLGLAFAPSLAIYSVFAAANVSTSAYPMLTVANARLIATFGTPEQARRFAAPQIAGEWFGTMCLSEPQAGSSLGDILTRAVADGEDELGTRYRLAGNKMWISGGDQDASANIVHLVLAKIAGPDGALPVGSKGISLFIVPKVLPDGTRNDVAVAGLNHKMGFRGTSNCLLNFGEGAGAIGWRVGEEGQGLAQMFLMMNEARIGVGMGAAALAYRGYRQSLRYAGERTQGRAVGERSGAPVAILGHPDVRRMMLQQKAYAEGALALCLFCADLVDRDAGGDAEAAIMLALLTPVAKSWPSEFGLIANDLAIQVHGGYGYTRDFDVEQLWRDNRLNPIHEGTTGIQAIDLLGRKLLLSDGAPLAALRARIAATVGRAGDEVSREAAAVAALWERLGAVVERLREAPGAAAFDEATLFLRAFGHGVVAWLWLDLAVTLPPDHPRRAGVLGACRFMAEAELPQARAWLDVVAAGSDLVRTLAPEVFA